jgi:serine/threonine protein kinase
VSTTEVRAGAFVGPYQVLFRLGKGGMGEVWAAARSREDLNFRSVCALKILRTRELTSNAAKMFFDEAKAAAALDHQSIVQTFDLGRDSDLLYIAMDLVRGPSLTALLQRLVIHRTRVPPIAVAHIGIQLASALDYAQTRASHEGKLLRLIHRDISPHNVLLDLSGTVRLTDFGVARTAIQDHESRVGTVRGKPSYMAPEQVMGEHIDARTDLFALGTVLHETASLRRLFGRSSPLKSMDAVLHHAPPRLTDTVPGFPEALAEVIHRALEKDPKQRFQSAAEMLKALMTTSRALGGTGDRSLVELIDKNFEAGTFSIDAKVEEALVAARNDPGGLPNIRVHQESQEMRSSADVAVVRAPTGAWPTVYAPDPLAPEALNAVRHELGIATPSESQPNVRDDLGAGSPYAEGSGSQPFVGLTPTRVSQWPVILMAVSAVFVAATAAYIVLRNTEEPNPPVVVEELDEKDEWHSPGPIVTPGPERPKAPEIPGEGTLGSGDVPEPVHPAPVDPRKPVISGNPGGKNLKRPSPSPKEPAVKPEAPIDYEAARAQVTKAFRVNKEKGGPLLSSLLEGGPETPPETLRLFHGQASAILRDAKRSARKD